jgi:hypothetical protein
VEKGLKQSYLILSVNRISGSNTTCMATSRWATWTIPIACTALSIWAILCHVASITADPADDVSRKVSLFWAVVFAMSDLATILTSLVLVITEGTVECGEFTELVAFELILALGDRCSLF